MSILQTFPEGRLKTMSRNEDRDTYPGISSASPHEMNVIPNKSAMKKSPIPKGIKGKSLEIYEFFITNPGYHSINSVQVEMKITTHELSTKHLEELLKSNLININEQGQYGIDFGDEEIIKLKRKLRYLKLWIPKTIIISISMLILAVTGFILYNYSLNPIIWYFLSIPALIFYSIIIFRDGYVMASKILPKE